MPGRTLSLAMATMMLMVSAAAGQSVRDLTIEEMEVEYRVALVIGNGAYAEGPLKNPPNDARAMAVALRACGFEVDERIDIDKREMTQAIRDFGRKIQRGGVGLFYFAGHGMQVKGSNFLIPVDADIQAEDDVEFEALDAAKVLVKMEGADNRVNIVILDACRNNPFARSFRSSSRGLVQMQAATGSLIAYATAPGKIAADGEGENGLYTEKLLRFINTPDLNIEQVFKNARQAVVGESDGQQTPWEASSLIGAFYFVLPEETGTPPVADAGPDRTANLNEIVRLDGSGSLAPEGEEMRYGWQQQEGPAVALLNADTATPSFSADQEGVYRFALVVNDGQQDSEPDEVVVQVALQQNARPVANGGADQMAAVNEVVRLDGQKSVDVDGGYLRYAWQQQEGPTVALLNADTATPAFTPAQEGVYRFALVVNDGQQDSESDEVMVQVIQKQQGSRKWIWWVVGAAATGGTGAVLLGGGGDGDSGSDTGAIDFEIQVP